jgi:hypothetical protein
MKKISFYLFISLISFLSIEKNYSLSLNEIEKNIADIIGRQKTGILTLIDTRFFLDVLPYALDHAHFLQDKFTTFSNLKDAPLQNGPIYEINSDESFCDSDTLESGAFHSSILAILQDLIEYSGYKIDLKKEKN